VITMARGKAKPSAKGPPAAQNKPVAKAGGMGRAAVLGAVLAAGAAACGYLLLMRRGSPLPTAPRSPAPTGGPPSETEEQRRRRLLQEGRGDPTMHRASCVDSWSGGCSSATAEACAGDPSVKTKCCNTCHKLTCVDTDPSCEAWSQSGECYKNTPFMLHTCCHSCTPDYDDKCTHYPTERPDVAEGDISKIFERALAQYPQYNPQVHSRDPWLVTFDNLLTDEETDGIFEAVGGAHGEYLKPSTTAKATRDANGRVLLQDVPDEIRTSYNAWCQHAGCYNHPVHERVIERIMSIVNLPQNNAEHMQLLKYHPGEYYRLHHDWIPEQLQALCGPRVFTFFLYLSDVEEGGGTRFPYLNLTVMPKRGSAVWWPHGLDSNPWQKDDRTHHEAMPVIKGEKRAANYWIHGSDFKKAMALGCDGRAGQPRRIWRK